MEPSKSPRKATGTNSSPKPCGSRLDKAGRERLHHAPAQLNLRARAYHRILKLARAIANLAGEQSIRPLDLAEALQCRPRNQFV